MLQWLKNMIRSVLPDPLLYKWVLPFKDMVRFKMIYLRYWLKYRKDINPNRSVVIISGESDTPGHIYRVERLMETLNGLGVHTVWYDPELVFANPDLIAECKLLICWRLRMTIHLQSVLEESTRHGIPVIGDLDDYVFDPDLAEPEITDAIRFQGLDKQKIKKLFQDYRELIVRSDILTCPTRFLAGEMAKLEKPVAVLPNGYDSGTLLESYRLIRSRPHEKKKRVLRIGYAGGTRTHQKDFELVVGPLVKIFDEFPEVRLVVFGIALSIREYPGLEPYIDRIENRRLVPLKELQKEIARFDINIAPLTMNAFNEAKSELKYFEAALLEVPTIASPTAPFANVIRHNVNGLLASSGQEWHECLRMLVSDRQARRRLGKNAHTDVLWNFGPEQRALLVAQLLVSQKAGIRLNVSHEQLRKLHPGDRPGVGYYLPGPAESFPEIVDNETILEFENGDPSLAGVVIPLYNYEDHILDALESVRKQTLKDLDLVVVDDCSTDGSLKKVAEWMEANHGRFNRCSLLRNSVNSKLSATRNVGFDHVQSLWVMQLDADNELYPDCMDTCLKEIMGTGAGLVYPQLELFGEDNEYIFRSYESLRLSIAPWDPGTLASYNYIDAMALVSKAAWAKVGGYDVSMVHGLEDYDLWLRFVEHGFFGIHIPKILARYRVHRHSMLRTETADHNSSIVEYLKGKHPWIDPGQ